MQASFLKTFLVAFGIFLFLSSLVHAPILSIIITFLDPITPVINFFNGLVFLVLIPLVPCLRTIIDLFRILIILIFIFGGFFHNATPS